MLEEAPAGAGRAISASLALLSPPFSRPPARYDKPPLSQRSLHELKGLTCCSPAASCETELMGGKGGEGAAESERLFFSSPGPRKLSNETKSKSSPPPSSPRARARGPLLHSSTYTRMDEEEDAVLDTRAAGAATAERVAMACILEVLEKVGRGEGGEEDKNVVSTRRPESLAFFFFLLFFLLFRFFPPEAGQDSKKKRVT